MKELEKSLGYLAWQHIMGAVLDVLQENKRLWKAEKWPEASSDDWAIQDLWRTRLCYRVAQRWAERANESGPFPYSVDQVVRLYMKVRKRNEDEVAEFESQVMAKVGRLV